ncbi:MAG: F-type H+-transporting ATPase subunit delta [Phycisphaerales bacterium]|jgi:F-type H+-transporting ATPase subunit delta
MPLIESQPDALARIYATALFELTAASGQAEAILGELEDILEAARGDKAFGEFLSSRVINADRREASLLKIFEGNASPVTLNFLRVLNDKDRLTHLPAITTAFDEKVQESYGRVEIDVFTASTMDAAALADVKARLSAAIGKDAIVHPYTDAAMVGGIKLRIGDQLIDGSVQSQLRQLKDNLTTDGAATLRSKFGKILEDNAGGE